MLCPHCTSGYIFREKWRFGGWYRYLIGKCTECGGCGRYLEDGKRKAANDGD